MCISHTHILHVQNMCISPGFSLVVSFKPWYYLYVLLASGQFDGKYKITFNLDTFSVCLVENYVLVSDLTQYSAKKSTCIHELCNALMHFAAFFPLIKI